MNTVLNLKLSNNKKGIKIESLFLLTKLDFSICTKKKSDEIKLAKSFFLYKCD